MRRWLPALALVGWLTAAPAAASCHDAPFAPPAGVRLDGDAALIVVHASATYDARLASKYGVDEAVRFARERNIPVVYLQDESPPDKYFASDCRPDYRIYSAGGEIRFDALPPHLYIVGGHLELCLSVALNEIIARWARQPPRKLRMTLFMDGIYSNGKSIDPAAPYHRDFARFMDVVTYGRPGGEHWPKLTLLETMGVIVDEQHELDYLMQVLPRWDTSFSDRWRVELQLNDSVVKVLRPAAGWNPPTLSFHFVDSADLAESTECLTGTGKPATCRP